jgi:hypothetical protein
MRRTFSVGMLTAIMLGTAFSASGMAYPKVLVTEHGTAVPDGSKVHVVTGVEPGSCATFEEATLVANDRSTVRVSLNNNISTRQCNSGYSLAGKVGSSLTLDWTGFLKLNQTHLVYQAPGPCTYIVNKFGAFLELPGDFGTQAKAFGWLRRELSNVTCPNLVSLSIATGVFRNGGKPGSLEIDRAELRG